MRKQAPVLHLGEQALVVYRLCSVACAVCGPATARGYCW